MSRLKVFLVIANYGHGNDAHLRVVRQEFARMPFDVTTEILSDIPKDVGPDVKVRVGIPGRSPWTLPFAYKNALRDHRDAFDLYIYCEDDILVTEQHVRAFLAATEALPPDTIAGFTRFERDEATGETYYIDMFRTYHFAPKSVVRYGGEVYAHLTNEHAGCFMLTRKQLAQVLDCPGFWKPPRKGLYGFPETAATEPYTQCGLTKLVSISRFDDFCLQHLPNKYWRKPAYALATSSVVRAQLDALLAGSETGRLFSTRLRIDSVRWNRSYYEPADTNVLARIPADARDVLSIGCGFGATEQALQRRGHRVTAIPLDPVIGSYAALNGVEILPPDLERAIVAIGERRFGAILLLDVLQFVDDPVRWLARCRAVLAEDGAIVVRAPNLLHSNLVRQLLERNVAATEALKLHRRSQSDFSATSLRRLSRWLNAAGFRIDAVDRIAGERFAATGPLQRWRRILPDFIATRDFLLVARRNAGLCERNSLPSAAVSPSNLAPAGSRASRLPRR